MSDEQPGTNGNGDKPVDPELRAAMAELRALEQNVLLIRANFARAAGLTFNDKRDTYAVFGYKDQLSTVDFRARYQRGGIAGRLVDVMPNACWRGEMEIIEDESKETYTPFEQAWHDFDQRLQVRSTMHRVDKLAGLSTYAVLLIGTTDGQFDQPLPRVVPGPTSSLAIAYLRPFAGGGGLQRGIIQRDQTVASGTDATIYEYETDASNPRFGKVRFYQLRGIGLNNEAIKTHWSRIIHVAENVLEDDIFGQPTLERVWNDLDDLDKVRGGGSEAFFLRANQGMHLDIDKDMALPAVKDTVEAIKEQIEAYKHGLDRWLRTRGVKAEVLGSDVANFSGPVDTIMTLIAGAKGMPKRILTGSEMGELASSQDRDNWKDQINGRQTTYLGPNVVRPFVDRLIEFGYLPAPGKSSNAYEVKWPHIQTLTEQEKADGAAKWAEVNRAMGITVFTDAEIRDKWYGMGPNDLPKEDADVEAWRAELALKMATTNKTEGAVIFTDDEIRKVCYGWDPLTPEEKIPITAPERVSATAPTPAVDAQGNPVPAAPPKGQPPAKALPPASGQPVPRAAKEADEDEELIRVLAAAIEAGNAEVVGAIIGLSIAPMHKIVAPGSSLCGIPTTEMWLTDVDQDVTCVKCLDLMNGAGGAGADA